MTSRYSVVCILSSPKAPGQQALTRPYRQLPARVAAAVLILVTIACSCLGSASDDAPILVHLPTLTRTPLPTLTPTTNSTAPAATPIPKPVSTPSVPAEVASNQMHDPGEVAPTHTPTTSNDATSSNLEFVSDTVPPPASPEATATETAWPTDTPTATATPTLTPPAPPTATPLPEGWVFSGVRASDNQDQHSLLLYGNLINNTGVTQDLAFMIGKFYDAQGQGLLDRLKFVDWPVKTVPQGGRVPFELTVTSLENVSTFELDVEARPSSNAPRQDFEFSDLNPANGPDNYCVAGTLRNPGSELQDFLTIVAVLYNGQDQVINFDDYYKYYPQGLVNDQTMDFELCVDPFDQEVARYELQAWGL